MSCFIIFSQALKMFSHSFVIIQFLHTNRFVKQLPEYSPFDYLLYGVQTVRCPTFFKCKHKTFMSSLTRVIHFTVMITTFLLTYFRYFIGNSFRKYSIHQTTSIFHFIKPAAHQNNLLS